jgi:hypothetical protein
MKYIISLFLIVTVIDTDAQSQFPYYQLLKTYWNYRYHLVGDAINRSQHMPFDKGQTFYPYGATGAPN